MNHRYFIQYFRRSRPYYTREFVKKALAAAKRGRKATDDTFFEAIVSAAGAAGVRTGGLLEHNFLPHEVVAAQCMVQLEHDDFPLYDMEPSLLEALANSDVGDMRLRDLRTPNFAYYVHWGPQSSLLLHEKFPVEGAFVFSHGEDWRIGLVARTSHNWLLPPERDVFQLRFPAECLPLPFTEAVDLALRRDLEGLADASTQLTANPERQLIVQEVRQELERNTPTLKAALHLVGNCIAYLTAYPEDSRFDWAPDTPLGMRAKTLRGGKEQGRTESKLRSMGYLQVHRVGLDFLQSAQRVESAAAAGGHGVRPHWRRGHWRHQAYGEKMSLRKLIWLRPTRVLGGPGQVEVAPRLRPEANRV